MLTRRDFLRTTSSAALAGFFLGRAERAFPRAERKARVVLIRHKNVIGDDGTLSHEVLADMLDEAVATLVGDSDPQRAWKKLIDPDDLVGVKSNEWDYLPTPAELESIVRQRLLQVGVAEDRMSIRDRRVLGNDVFMNATALINARPLRTHHWSGVGSLVKNYIMFVERPQDYHPDSCADLAKLWKLPIVAGKTRLNILVALTPLFHGIGPHHYNPKYVWPYRGLIVGLDPVAVDTTGVRILQAKRRDFFGEHRLLTPPPKHVFLADTRHGLGTSDPEKIELIKLGLQDGAYI
jgi:hypothetical protein